MGEKKKKVKMGILGKLLAISIIPIIIMALVLTIYSANTLSSALENESLDGLSLLAQSVEAGYSAVDPGDYLLGEDGDLYKGVFNVTKNISLIDSFTKTSGAEITIFYGDTRLATSLINSTTKERIVGTKAADVVISTVLNKGETYKVTKLIINDRPYNAYYMPLKNSDGSVIGMIFAGIPSSDLIEYTNKKVAGIIIIAVGILILVTISISIFSKSIASAIKKAEIALVELSKGNLQVNVDEKIMKRNDEIGSMGRALHLLISELQMIIGNIKKSANVLLVSGNSLEAMANQTSMTADEINHAIEDISKGAISQAEDIETATLQVSNMGTAIEDIVGGVSKLDGTSSIMKKAGDESVDIMEELSRSNDRTTDAIRKIDIQVHATDESVKQIQTAVSVITSIASETSLLSLNASIEAARAGEAGRGFSVVATEIKKLAEESSSSAKTIEEVISKLSADSQLTVDVMNQVKKIVDEQQNKLDATKEKFKEVSVGIDSSRGETETIKNQSEICDKSRGKVEDVIQNLAAISEENAASSEETTASMQELNATINLLAESARELKKLSINLEQDMTFFKI